MKILIIGNGAIGNINGKHAINKHTSQFCEELLQKGYNVGFLQFEKSMEKNEGLQDSKINNEIKVYTISTSLSQNKIYKALSYLKISLLLFKTLRKYDFVYIFYPGFLPYLAVSFCNILKTKYALYVRGVFDTSSRIESFFIKNANFCLTVSDLLKEQLHKKNRNVEIIAPMIDFSITDVIKNRNFNIKGKKRCLFVGRIEMKKGVFILAETIKKLSKKNIDIFFDIVGSGEDLHSLISVLSDNNNVVIHGQISDKNKLFSLYKNSDMFVFPTYYPEGFPRVIYEAMIANTPIITTNAGGIGNMMKNEHNCLIVQQKDANSLYEAIVRLNNSPNVVENITDQATRDIMKILDGERQKHSILLSNKLELLNF